MKPTFSPQAQVQQAIAILAATVGGGLASLNEIKRMIAAETMNQTKAGGNAVTETFDDSARKNMNKVIKQGNRERDGLLKKLKALENYLEPGQKLAAKFGRRSFTVKEADQTLKTDSAPVLEALTEAGCMKPGGQGTYQFTGPWTFNVSQSPEGRLKLREWAADLWAKRLEDGAPEAAGFGFDRTIDLSEQRYGDLCKYLNAQTEKAPQIPAMEALQDASPNQECRIACLLYCAAAKEGESQEEFAQRVMGNPADPWLKLMVSEVQVTAALADKFLPPPQAQRRKAAVVRPGEVDKRSFASVCDQWGEIVDDLDSTHATTAKRYRILIRGFKCAL